MIHYMPIWEYVKMGRHAGSPVPTIPPPPHLFVMLAQLAAALSDRYRIEREIGAGGMATVYLAHDLKHDRAVALKVLRPELEPMLGAERFEREIRLAARLQHPHILTVLDSGDTAGQLWFTMPYVSGEGLRARLQRERQLPVRDAVRIAREAAQALQYAHEQGVVHRDIKPDNILLTSDGSVLVADFGIARAIDAASTAPLTRSGVSVGTPAYMSPEQASGDEVVDARTDVYSLGVVLYELLAGEPPFTGATAHALMLKRLTLAPPSVRVVRPAVSESLDLAIQHALAPVPGDRLPSAAAFIDALDATTAERAVTTTASSRRRTRATRPALPALALGLILGAGVLFAWRRGAEPAALQPAAARIAVLPFENLGDTADAYFADGVTDAVRGKLTALPALQVIARGSSVQYGQSDKTPREIASELGVRYLLTGTVRWAKGADGVSRVQVNPELVEVNAGEAASRWQQPFDAPLTEVFKLQADIATKVTEALRVRLPDAGLAATDREPTANPAAYDAYLRARAAWNSGSNTAPTAMRRALALYQKSVALDSGFAPAWGGIALASTYLYANGVPTPELAKQARTALDRATALDPGGVETSIIRSRYLALVELDIARALAELETVLPRAPGDAVLFAAISIAERSLGRWDESLRHAEKAYALDPRTAVRASALSLVYLWLRQPAAAEAPANRAVALAPANPTFIQRQAMVALAKGDLAGARRNLADATEVPAADLAAYMTNMWDLGWVLDDAGQRLALSLGAEAFDGDDGAVAMARDQPVRLARGHGAVAYLG